MAKKIRFPLKMNDADVRSIEELRENFDMEAVIGYYTDGKLSVWLRDRYYTDEADAIDALDESDENLGSKIASVLGVEISDDGVDVDEIRQRREKYELLSRYISDKEILDNIDIVAVDQDDLYDILDSGSDKIYLFKETFTVPANKGDVTYIGLNGAKVKIQGKTDFRFYKINLFFSNIEFVTTDPEELWQLYICYHNGYGVEQDFEKAIEMEKMAAEAGHVEAQVSHGYHCASEDDYVEAVKWFTKAAEQGDSEAQYILGNAYHNGKYGLKPDHNEAIKWYTKAVEQGNVNAMFHLGELYFFSESDPMFRDYKKDEKAFELFSKAANEGDKRAWFYLGECYCWGRGVKYNEYKFLGIVLSDNYNEAEKWYKKALEYYREENYRIPPELYIGLAMCYANSCSPIQNIRNAEYWFEMAKQTGCSSKHFKDTLSCVETYIDSYHLKEEMGW